MSITFSLFNIFLSARSDNIQFNFSPFRYNKTQEFALI